MRASVLYGIRGGVAQQCWQPHLASTGRAIRVSSFFCRKNELTFFELTPFIF
jgi:hypothetical protein